MLMTMESTKGIDILWNNIWQVGAMWQYGTDICTFQDVRLSI